MNALFLKDLAAKTRRGQRGRVEAGKAGGSLGYGYDVVKALDSAGEPVRGERRINEQQAGIVRRIFREFAAGGSPRAIARRLNDDGIPGPRGRRWSDNTLRGHAKRGTGLLNNELYVGRLVWSRQRRALNPETGREVSRINPPEEWVVAEVPHLRILDDDLWKATKGRQKESAEKYAAVIAGARRRSGGRKPLSREFRAGSVRRRSRSAASGHLPRRFPRELRGGGAAVPGPERVFLPARRRRAARRGRHRPGAARRPRRPAGAGAGPVGHLGQQYGGEPGFGRQQHIASPGLRHRRARGRLHGL